MSAKYKTLDRVPCGTRLHEYNHLSVWGKDLAEVQQTLFLPDIPARVFQVRYPRLSREKKTDFLSWFGNLDILENATVEQITDKIFSLVFKNGQIECEFESAFFQVKVSDLSLLDESKMNQYTFELRKKGFVEVQKGSRKAWQLFLDAPDLFQFECLAEKKGLNADPIVSFMRSEEKKPAGVIMTTGKGVVTCILQPTKKENI